MRIESHSSDINVYTVEDKRLSVSVILSGYALEAHGYPYSEYIVEWEYTPHMGKPIKKRKLLIMPEEDTTSWFRDLIEEKKERGYTLTGIMKLSEITLAKPLT